jgi:GTP cyclohydrolase I
MVDQQRVRAAVRELLAAIGEDPDRPGLAETPQRVAEMYAEIVSGIQEDPRAHLKVVFDEGHDEIVIARSIPLYSICEHHLLPFHGQAHVAYLPNESGQICGLSKVHRLVQSHARRPQLQERLTTEIADSLEDVLEPRGVFVVIEAEHLCVSMRGVRMPGSKMVTSAVRGFFRRSAATRAEVMALFRPGTA